MKRAALAAVGVFFSAALVTWLISCGGGGGGGAGVFDGTVDLGSKGQDIVLPYGQVWSMAFTVHYDVRRFGGPYGSVAINLQDNLANLTFTPQAQPGNLSEGPVPLGTTMGAFVELRVSRIEALDTVCSDGDLYQFAVVLDGQYQPLSAEPLSLQAGTATTSIINTGAYSVCVRVSPPVGGVVDLDRVGFQVAPCGEPPADIAGTWTGLYSCDSNCTAESGSVTLVITQDSRDPSRATYTDEGGATYEGTVCGSRFSFRGGLAGSYDESGTFVMNPDGLTASKTSSYRMLEGGCRGDCTDTLTRSD